jgi:hypothetical protein
MSAINYEVARQQIAPVLSSANRIEEVRLARSLAAAFRQQYAEAGAIARAARERGSQIQSEPLTAEPSQP